MKSGTGNSREFCPRVGYSSSGGTGRLSIYILAVPIRPIDTASASFLKRDLRAVSASHFRFIIRSGSCDERTRLAGAASRFSARSAPPSREESPRNDNAPSTELTLLAFVSWILRVSSFSTFSHISALFPPPPSLSSRHLGAAESITLLGGVALLIPRHVNVPSSPRRGESRGVPWNKRERRYNYAKRNDDRSR